MQTRLRIRVIFASLTALLLAHATQLSAHLTRNECIQGTGCIAGSSGGTAIFEFTAATRTGPSLHTGFLNYTDASAGINLTSTILIDYGESGTPGERLLAYQLSGGVYSEARVFVSDGGGTASDTFRIQLLSPSSVPIYEAFGTLLSVCGGGIVTDIDCPVQIPCVLELTVSCGVAGAAQTESTAGNCVISATDTQATFYYTIKNNGTVAVPIHGLRIEDAFGVLDLSNVVNDFLAPGQEITFGAIETITGNFPFVNTAVLDVATGAISCSDMATVTVNRATPPGGEPGAECDDFVTGGGWILGTPSGEKANFGIHGGVRKGSFWGGLNYIDHATGMHVKSTGVTGYSHLSEVGRQINFNVTIDGVAGTAICQVYDNGEPGRDDVFQIQLSNGYSAGGDLGGNRSGGGNLQLHKSKCDKGGKGSNDSKGGNSAPKGKK